MEDKEQLTMERAGSKASYCHGISILVLSLLLSATVATVIYMSLHTATCQAPALTTAKTKSSFAKQHQSFNLVGEDGTKVTEAVDYDESREVSVLHQPGVFQVNDFGKGIDIVKDMETDGCYVIPVGADMETSRAHAQIMKSYHGEELRDPGNTTYYVRVIPGQIEDTSFIPHEADAECSHYNWVSILGEQNAQGGVVRHKRGFLSDLWSDIKDAAKDAVKAAIVKKVVTAGTALLVGK